MKELKPRNPYAVSARNRKAGAHTSTDRKRGGRRGGSLDTDLINEQLTEYEGHHENQENNEE